MAQKKDNLPVNTEPVVSGGTISYANEVIAIISGIAASEIEGIAGMVTAGGLGEIISKNRNITRGVKVEVGTEEVSVDLYTIVEYGQPIQKVASEVQENVRKSIESMTGLKVVRVDIHVQGVSFEKDKKETQSRVEAANIPHIAEPEQDKKAKKQAREAKPKAETVAKPDEKAASPEPEVVDTTAAAPGVSQAEAPESPASEAPASPEAGQPQADAQQEEPKPESGKPAPAKRRKT